jgi:SAM-dependent methyltransferase
MMRQCRKLVQDLGPSQLAVLEISGHAYRDMGFRKYVNVDYPSYDICVAPLEEKFDLIIAQQVFEHLLWPYRAGRNVYAMLKAGGHFLISTPFLVRVHNDPVDCTRWTETGLKYFLAECGFPLESIRTGSWGNRACIRANFGQWIRYRPFFHSLRNEPDFPYHVWALAGK